MSALARPGSAFEFNIDMRSVCWVPPSTTPPSPFCPGGGGGEGVGPGKAGWGKRNNLTTTGNVFANRLSKWRLATAIQPTLSKSKWRLAAAIQPTLSKASAPPDWGEANKLRATGFQIISGAVARRCKD